MILTSVLILVTFPWADSLFCFRKARDERLRPGSRQRKGCDGFREEDLSPVATKGCRGGHRLSLATLPPPDWYRNFPIRFCFNTISLDSFFSLQVLPSSQYFTAFQRNFHSLGEINLRFGDPPTSAWSRFRITTSLGGSTSRPRYHYSSKTSLKADASKLVSIFSSLLQVDLLTVKSHSKRRRSS